LPIAGVWLSCGLACVALVWLLTACIPPLWALFTTLLFLLNPTVLVGWSQSYWGGYVAFIGGALFFGSLFRLIEKRKTSTSSIMAIGIFILSISRPAEGLLVVTIGMIILYWSWKNNSIIKNEGWPLMNYATALVFGAAVIVIFHLFYNNAVSGTPFKYPYFNWSYKDSNIDIIRNYTGSTPLSNFKELTRTYNFFYTPYLGIILLALFFVKDKKIIILSTIFVVIQTSVSVFFTKGWPHYMAPTAPLHYVLIGTAFYTLSCMSTKGIRTGGITASGLYIGFILLFISSLFLHVQSKVPYTWGQARQEKIKILNKTKAKNIVFIRYSRSHKVLNEWVYNEADIDQSQIIWARDLGNEKNKELIAYYPERNVWLLKPDKQPLTMRLY
jgi:hypothetical protein